MTMEIGMSYLAWSALRALALEYVKAGSIDEVTSGINKEYVQEAFEAMLEAKRIIFVGLERT